MRIVYLIALTFLPVLQCFASDGGNWQQRADFNINVSLSDASRFLDGDISILYTNNSLDTLNIIYIHLWPNAYSRHNTALARQLIQQGNLDMNQLAAEEMGAIGHLDFTVNDLKAEFERDEVHPDYGVLKLNTPLPPGGQVVIETPFRVKVPKMVSRLGYEGDFFAISQWYPKPAVYDKDGWHPMPYLDQGEFYSDFGKYVVSINVPERYTVAATGNQTHEVTENGRRTVIYEQDNIIDFAWFASPDFKRDSREVALPGGKRVMVQTYYTTEDGLWQQVGAMAENALKFYSDKIGPYPYGQLTLVEGPLKSGGGMEYPTITIIQNTTNLEWLEVVTAHEVGHNWWQASLANNERIHPWIDEGFTSYYDRRYSDEAALNPFRPESRLAGLKVARMLDLDHLTYDDFSNMRILQEERTNRHQAISIHPSQTTATNYQLNHYQNMAVLVEHLAAYAGVDLFDDCMRAFYAGHRFRLISPDDLQEHFESCTGKDLDYLFQDRIRTSSVVDSRIRKVALSGDTTNVHVGRKGIAVPVPVTAESDTGQATVWLERDEHIAQFTLPGIKRIYLDPDNLTLDYNRQNNYWKSKGFGKLERISPFIMGSIENPQRSRFFVMPVIAGNTHDKFMLGMAFYNRVWPAKDIDWNIVPMYAFGSKQANGIANFTYYQNIRRERHVQIAYNVHFKTFSYDNSSTGGRYINFVPSIKATILPPDRSKNVSHVLELKHHQNWIELNLFEQQDSVTVLVDELYSGQGVGELRYTILRDDVKVPVSVSAYAYNNTDFLKVGTELNFKIRYGKIKSYVHGRFVLEGFAWKKNDLASSSNQGYGVYGAYRTGLGGTPGANDYLFENAYLGRSESDGFASRQIYMDRGQFKFSDPGLLRANTLLTSVNIRADFPSKWVPIKLYMDFGVAMNAPASGLFAFQMGGILSLFNEGIEVYFPFFSSDEIKGFYELNVPKYKHRITFSFDLDKLNPHARARTYSM